MERIFLDERNLLLWNKLGSDNQVENSPVGPDGVLLGGAYAAGKFNEGLNSIANSNHAEFPSHLQFRTKGALGLWFKPAFDDTDVTVRGIVSDADGDFAPSIRWNGAGAFEVFIGSNVVSHSPTFNSGDLIHLAIAYDEATIEGTTDKIRFYYNKVLAGSTSSLDDPVDAELIRVGNSSTNTQFANGVCDNLKVWDYPKTNYSDIETESISKVSNIHSQEKEGLILWNKLESEAGAGASEVGPSFDENNPASDAYSAGQFGNAYDKDTGVGNVFLIMQGSWVSALENFSADKGCVHLWFSFPSLSGTSYLWSIDGSSGDFILECYTVGNDLTFFLVTKYSHFYNF